MRTERVDILFGSLVLTFLGALSYCYWIVGEWADGSGDCAAD